MEKLNQSKSATLYTAQFNKLVSTISAAGVTYDLQQEAEKLDDLMFCHARRTQNVSQSFCANQTSFKKQPSTLPFNVSRHSKRSFFDPRVGAFIANPRTTTQTTARSSKNVTFKPRSPMPSCCGSCLNPVAKPLAKKAKETNATSLSHKSMPPLKSILKKTKLPSTQALSFKNNRFEPLSFDEPPCPLTTANSDSTTTEPLNAFDYPQYNLLSMKNHHSSAFSGAPGLVICQGTIQDHPVSILIDSGATPSFIHANLLFIQDSFLQAQDYKIR
ncbi:hypothetical protein BJ741DRAFT_608144 [Chytriomyces cf. hyalinus JEL632]|nr:hypothetical protein BJ741DRAFT_608144 [Chytriomyces cf. hyalinus JEL632]